jgi:O-antigen/teichoic acid export membrane protein
MSERDNATGQSIARDGLWMTLDNIATAVFAVVGSVIVARALGPTKMGHYNYVIWVGQMLRLVADLGLPFAVRRYASEERGRGNQVTVATIAATAERLQRTLAFFSAVAALGFVFTAVAPEQRIYAGIVMLSVAPSLLTGVPASVLWATGKLGVSVRASLAGTVLNFFLTVAALACGLELLGLALALLVGRLVDVALRFRAYWQVLAELPEPEARLPSDLRQRMFTFCWQQTLLLAMEVVIWNRSELFVLERYAPIREVAFFSLMFNLVQFPLFLPYIMAGAVSATMMVRQGQAPQTVGPMASASLWLVFLVALPAALGLAAVAEPLVRVMFGDQYLPAIPVLELLALFGVARALSYPVLAVLSITEHQGFVVRWSLVMVALNVALALWWIPLFGAVGAACVKGAVQFASLVGLWIYAARVNGLRLALARAVRVFGAAAAMALCVHSFASVVPPVVGLLVGIPLGVVLLAVMLRLTGALDSTDAERLVSLGQRLPGAVRGKYVSLLRALVPSYAPQLSNSA